MSIYCAVRTVFKLRLYKFKVEGVRVHFNTQGITVVTSACDKMAGLTRIHISYLNVSLYTSQYTPEDGQHKSTPRQGIELAIQRPKAVFNKSVPQIRF